MSFHVFLKSDSHHFSHSNYHFMTLWASAPFLEGINPIPLIFDSPMVHGPCPRAFAGRSVEGTRLFIEDQPGWQLVAVLQCGGLGSTRRSFPRSCTPNSSMDDHDSVLKQPAGDFVISHSMKPAYHGDTTGFFLAIEWDIEQRRVGDHSA
jgi:hypothetical protein